MMKLAFFKRLNTEKSHYVCKTFQGYFSPVSSFCSMNHDVAAIVPLSALLEIQKQMSKQDEKLCQEP